MAGTTDFVPFAAATGANVTAQATYLAEASTATGFVSGEASSADCNKVWRQATFPGAGLATFIADTLNINVADDGNLSVFVTNLQGAITAIANTALTGFATVAFVNTNFQTITNAENASSLTTGTLAAARLPASFSVGGTITAGAFNVSSDARLKSEIEPIGGALDRLALLRGVTFRWIKSNSRAAGVIAQEVRKAVPEGVDTKSGNLTVDPMAVVGVLIEALKEESAARRFLESRVAVLESR
jgi:Chaperone of endosialidase